jgi:hypothetical protein
MLTAGFRCAPDTAPMNRMIAITMDVGRVLPLSGVVFVVLAVLAVVVLGGDTPGNDAAAAEVFSFYDAHTVRQAIAAFVFAVSVPFLVFFGVSLATTAWPESADRLRPSFGTMATPGALGSQAGVAARFWRFPPDPLQPESPLASAPSARAKWIHAETSSAAWPPSSSGPGHRPLLRRRHGFESRWGHPARPHAPRPPVTVRSPANPYRRCRAVRPGRVQCPPRSAASPPGCPRPAPPSLPLAR